MGERNRRVPDSGNKEEISVICIDQGGGKSSVDILFNISPTLTTTHYGALVVFITEEQEHE